MPYLLLPRPLSISAVPNNRLPISSIRWIATSKGLPSTGIDMDKPLPLNLISQTKKDTVRHHILCAFETLC